MSIIILQLEERLNKVYQIAGIGGAQSEGGNAGDGGGCLDVDALDEEWDPEKHEVR